MTTICLNKNNIHSKSQNVSDEQALSKFFVLDNIFLDQYQVKQVHLIRNGEVLYETLKQGKKHLVHQVQIQTQSLHEEILYQQVLSIEHDQKIFKVFIESQNFEGTKQKPLTLKQLFQLAYARQKFQLRIIISPSLDFQSIQIQSNLDLNIVLDHFLLCMEDYKNGLKNGINTQNSIPLRNFSTQRISFYEFLEKLEIAQKKNFIRTFNSFDFVKIYLLCLVCKNLKELLNFSKKPAQFLLQMAQNKLNRVNCEHFTEFLNLIRDVIRNKEKHTEKMLNCYVQILREKYIQSRQQSMISKILKPQENIHQPPQKDVHPCNYKVQPRQKSSNSFIFLEKSKNKQSIHKTFHQSPSQQSPKNLLIQSTKNEGYNFLGPRSSSFTSMSPNRKNRKYVKCTTGNLFAATKQNSSMNNFCRTSSSSFLRTGKDKGNRMSFLEKTPFAQTVTLNDSKEGWFRKEDFGKRDNNDCEDKVRSYLQTMGFKNKDVKKQSRESQIKTSVAESSGTVSKFFMQPNDRNERAQVNQDNQSGSLQRIEQAQIVPRQLAKQRLTQSLSLFYQKASKTSTLNSSIGQRLGQKQLSYACGPTKKPHHSIIPSETFQPLSQDQSPQSGPISQTVVHKNISNGDLIIDKSAKFKIQKLNDMNIKVRGKQKNKSLRLDRMTVMILHVSDVGCIKRNDSFKKGEQTSKRNDQQSCKKDELSKRKNNEINQEEEYQVVKYQNKERRPQKQMTFKPSLASVKKEKPIKEQSSDIKQSLGQKQSVPHSKQQKSKQPNLRNQPLPQQEPPSLQEQQIQSISTYNLSNNKSSTSLTSNQNLVSTSLLSKTSFKQLFLTINSQNKTFIDLLQSRLSYQITFYAFYINYFKLNIIKTTTKDAIQKMLTQMKDYQQRIRESEQISSAQKMLPQYKKAVDKLLKIDIESFVYKWANRDELKNKKDLQEANRISEDLDSICTEILLVSVKIMEKRALQLQKSLTKSQQSTTLICQSLKLTTTIHQLLFLIANNLLTKPAAELKKLSSSMAQESQPNLLSSLSKFQQLTSYYETLIAGCSSSRQLSNRPNLKVQMKRIKDLVGQ